MERKGFIVELLRWFDKKINEIPERKIDKRDPDNFYHWKTYYEQYIRIFYYFVIYRGIQDPKELRKILSKHYELVECDNPDYLFYSVFGYEHLKYDCISIFITGENFSPDFNVCDYAMGFDHISFEDRYLRVPLYLFYDYADGVSERVSLTEDDIRSKCKFCNFVYSNSKNASPIREEFFHKLSAYKTVDSGGRFLNNIGGPVEDKDEFQKQYKFSIAFENSSTSGYTTEKLFEALKNL